mmetsp:Transcript_12204/g.23801  ORF Transcript_12204/g.23801 Transcript_12204/m.23801 type:complete len:471 (-) Transcript_12204:50-1462(-)
MIAPEFNRIISCIIVLIAIGLTFAFMIDLENSFLSSISSSPAFAFRNASISSSAEPLQLEHQYQHPQITARSETNTNETSEVVVDDDESEASLLIPCTTLNGRSLFLNATQFWKRRGCLIGNMDSLRFFHLGKGGGGTIEFILKDYHVAFERNHPRPRFDLKLLRGPTTTLLINIRDPVDRFVSAFKWRALLFCGKDDTRVKYTKGNKRPPHIYPDKVCYGGDHQEEKQMLHQDFQYDPNLLAEALCEDSPDFETTAEKLKLIAHARYSLNDWLKFLVDPEMYSAIGPKGIRKVMALTTEPRVGNNHTSLLDWHTQQAILELYSYSDLNDEQIELILKHKPQLSENKKSAADKKTHSSTSSSVANIVDPHPLRKLGECCLARFFRDDYRLIKAMLPKHGFENFTEISPLQNVHPLLNSVCSWGSDEQRASCMADLESMIRRRAGFLDNSLGSCKNVVAEASHDSSNRNPN